MDQCMARVDGRRWVEENFVELRRVMIWRINCLYSEHSGVRRWVKETGGAEATAVLLLSYMWQTPPTARMRQKYKVTTLAVRMVGYGYSRHVYKSRRRRHKDARSAECFAYKLHLRKDKPPYAIHERSDAIWELVLVGLRPYFRERYWQALAATAAGQGQRELAAELGVTQVRVSQYVVAAREAMAAVYGTVPPGAQVWRRLAAVQKPPGDEILELRRKVADALYGTDLG